MTLKKLANRLVRRRAGTKLRYAMKRENNDCDEIPIVDEPKGTTEGEDRNVPLNPLNLANQNAPNPLRKVRKPAA
jgi:hypothetical protein